VVAMPPTVPYKRQHHRRSLAESDPGTNGSAAACLDAAGASAAIVRASVLRDGKGRSTTLSPADLTAANYRSISMWSYYFSIIAASSATFLCGFPSLSLFVKKLGLQKRSLMNSP